MIEIIMSFVVTMLVIGLLSLAFGWKNLYYRLLLRDLEKWQAKGWLTQQGAKNIAKSVRPVGLGARLVFLVGFLGAVLLLFAAISFVAANWESMSRLSRFTWLIVAMWLTFLIGWRFTANKHLIPAEIAWLLGTGLFGVNIVLIAQMFHIDSHPPDGVLMWAIGALIAAALLQSRTALLLAYGGALAWTMMEIVAYGSFFHWPFLLVWLAAFAITLWQRWSPAYHMAFLSLLTWTMLTVMRYAIEGQWSPHGVLALFIVGFLFMLAVSLLLQARHSASAEPGFGYWVEKYAIVGLLPALFGLQTIPWKKMDSSLTGRAIEMPENPFFLFWGHWGWLPLALLLFAGLLILLALGWRKKLLLVSDYAVFAAIGLFALLFSAISTPGLFLDQSALISRQTHDFLATWVYGTAFLALLLWLIAFGHRRQSDLYVWVALLAFAGEVLYIYFRIFGSLLETSLFFLVGGLLTMGLAFFLFRLHKRLDLADPSMASDNISGEVSR